MTPKARGSARVLRGLFGRSRRSRRSAARARRRATLIGLDLLSRILFRLLPGRRRALEDHLELAFPAAGRTRRVRLQRIARIRILEGLLSAGGRGAEPRFVAFEHLEAARRAGRGVLVLTLHLGPHERALRRAAERLGGLTVVGRPLPRLVAQSVLRGRRRAGVVTLPPRGALGESLRRLARREVVVLVLDQHTPGRSGCFVPFFGREAATSAGLAWLAARTGAPVIPVEPFFGAGGRTVIRAHPPLPPASRQAELRALTASYTQVLEAMVRRHPTQWLWTHRRFKTPPGPSP